MKKTFQEKDLQFFIGNILRFGVLISMAIVFIGLSLFLVENRGSMVDFSTFDIGSSFDIKSFWSALLSFQSAAIIHLGIICLIITPVLRVVFAIIGFALENDHLYVVISSIVLLIIVASIILGAVG